MTNIPALVIIIIITMLIILLAKFNNYRQFNVADLRIYAHVHVHVHTYPSLPVSQQTPSFGHLSSPCCSVPSCSYRELGIL